VVISGIHVSHDSFPAVSELLRAEVCDLHWAVACCHSKLIFHLQAFQLLSLHSAGHGRFFPAPYTLAAAAWQRGSSSFSSDSEDHLGNNALLDRAESTL